MTHSLPAETLDIRNEFMSASIPANFTHSALREAILRTVAYGDVFDYPMTAMEIHRYLVGLPAGLQSIVDLLAETRRSDRQLSLCGKYICLHGREELAGVRRQRERISRHLWPRARRYGRLIASLPFVRMVAVTGSLAVDNPETQGDIDYLLVTTPGRVWLCRALAILIVRWARLHGDRLCPNYVLSVEHLESSQKDLYNAHELAQMVPLTGMQTYFKMRHINRWTSEFLPNSSGVPAYTLSEPRRNIRARLGLSIETPLSGRLGNWLEQWEMARKVSRFSQQAPANEEAGFCADWCKGHFDQHARRSLEAFHERLAALGLDP